LSRLIVISNRVMIPDGRRKESSGGLAVAVQAALERMGGIWIGWSGETVDSEPDGFHMKTVGKVTYATLDLAEQDYEQYYNGYANKSLWPLMHYRLDLTEFSRQNFSGYNRVNELFAKNIAPLLEPDDIVWIHDYHFLPLASELRKLKCRQKMGFFLHIPWPAREVLLALPNHADLVSALLEFDVIGFQTRGNVMAFLDYVIREAGGTAEPNGTVYLGRRKTVVKHFPISIETEDFVKLADEAESSSHVRRLKESIGDRHLILGVDRLDYSKGLLHRMQAFDQFLNTYPDHKRGVTFMQIAPPSRTDVLQYQEIRQELEAEAGYINGAHSEFDWVPVRYLNKGFSRRVLAGFYRHSRVGFVTPLRDGMNLVAKEFVAAQSHADPGVLVLSRFAGAAEEMTGALLVNPYDTEGMAQALNTAIHMPLEERRSRWGLMMEQLLTFDVHRWHRNCVAEIENFIRTASR